MKVCPCVHLQIYSVLFCSLQWLKWQLVSGGATFPRKKFCLLIRGSFSRDKARELFLRGTVAQGQLSPQKTYWAGWRGWRPSAAGPQKTCWSGWGGGREQLSLEKPVKRGGSGGNYIRGSSCLVIRGALVRLLLKHGVPWSIPPPTLTTGYNYCFTTVTSVTKTSGHTRDQCISEF